MTDVRNPFFTRADVSGESWQDGVFACANVAHRSCPISYDFCDVSLGTFCVFNDPHFGHAGHPSVGSAGAASTMAANLYPQV
jgi:hypothetical protein